VVGSALFGWLRDSQRANVLDLLNFGTVVARHILQLYFRQEKFCHCGHRTEGVARSVKELDVMHDMADNNQHAKFVCFSTRKLLNKSHTMTSSGVIHELSESFSRRAHTHIP
jgi:hypothetical protein